MNVNEDIKKIKEELIKESNIVKEINSLFNSIQLAENNQERKMAESHIEKLQRNLKTSNEELLKNLEKLNIKNPLIKQTNSKIEIHSNNKQLSKKESNRLEKKSKLNLLERSVIERLKNKEKKDDKKPEEKSSGEYKKFAEKVFSPLAKSLIKSGIFKKIGSDLTKSNLDYNIITYISMSLLNVAIALGIGFFTFLFFLFFNLSPLSPIIVLMEESIGVRFLKVFWILLALPGVTAIFMSSYPSLEKKSVEGKIDAELPFAVIHMAAISGSMIDPVKIFSIIVSTKEYPNLEKEFNKLLNEINIYGYDFVTSLKDIAMNSPSKKLAELFNGLSTTITSGGTLYGFFEKRSQSLLFEYRLDKEKNTKSAESFMDIYISIVIAAPMVLMLLLMMMKISGLGLNLSTNMITFVVVGGVSLINILFIGFLQIKQQATG